MTTPVSNNGDNNNFDEILDRCLRAIEAGQATIEQCAARYPNYPELANLLRMAVAFSDLPRPQMPDAVRLERRLQAQLRERARVAAPRRSAFSPLRRLLFTVAALLIILFAGGAGLVTVSANALPGDGLNYSIKRNVESVRLRLGNETLYDVAETRLNEIRGLAAQGRSVGTAVLDEMYNSVGAALQSVNDTTKRITLVNDAENAVRDALSKGMIDPQLADLNLQKLQITLQIYVPNMPNGTGTPTPGIVAQPTTGTPSPVPSVTSTVTVASSVTLTPSFTASVSETPAPPTIKPSVTSTPTATATFTATVPRPVLGPSYTATLGRGPAVTVPGVATKTATTKATEDSTAQQTVAATDTPTTEGTEASTEPATEAATATIESTATPTATETSTSTNTPTATFTNTPLPSATPIPPTATFTETPVPTPNGLPLQDLKQNPQEVTFHGCKPEGNSGDPALNLNRNRVDDARQYPQTGFDNIAKLPWPKDAEGKPHDQWSQDTRNVIGQVEGLPVMVEVNLIKVQENGLEEQNCGSNDHTWQLWLLPGPGNDQSKALIASISPRVASKHAGWTLDKLNALAAAGARVRVSGWLLFNEETPGDVGKSRVSLWEIHPVMQIAVNKGGQWVNLDDYQP